MPAPWSPASALGGPSWGAPTLGVFTAKSAKPTSRRSQVASPAPSRSAPIALAAQGRDPPIACAPPAINISHAVPAPWAGSGPCWRRTELMALAARRTEHRDMPKAGVGTSWGASSPCGCLCPKICFLPCSHLQVCPCPCARLGGCPGLSSSGCCGTHGGLRGRVMAPTNKGG